MELSPRLLLWGTIFSLLKGQPIGSEAFCAWSEVTPLMHELTPLMSGGIGDGTQAEALQGARLEALTSGDTGFGEFQLVSSVPQDSTTYLLLLFFKETHLKEKQL